MTFLEILDSKDSSPSVLNDRLYMAANGLGWNTLRPGENILFHEHRRSIAIGVVAWSRPDVALLDDFAKRDHRNTSVWFFIPDLWGTGQSILPPVPLMTATPMLVEYVGTTPIAFLQGRPAVAAYIEALYSKYSGQGDGS
jgi:hypothetical protein